MKNTTEQVEKDFKRIQEWVKEALPNDWDKIDLKSEFDSKLSYIENKNIIREKCKPFMEHNLKEQVEQAIAQKDKERKVREEEKEALLQSWKEGSLGPLVQTSKVALMENYLDFIHNSDVHSLVIRSKAGLGKTHTVLNYLKNKSVETKYVNGWMTPLKFYMIIYENRNKTIVLDDCDNAFKNDTFTGLLKGAVYEAKSGKRLVCYETTAKVLKDNDIPDWFEFTGKMIILTNELDVDTEDEHYNALASRTISLELKYSHQEVLDTAQDIMKSKGLTERVITRVNEIINKNVTPVSEFNFRLLDRLIKMVQYDNVGAEVLYVCSIQENEELKLVYKLANSHFTVKEQEKAFCDETGRGRATFFRLRKRAELRSCKR